MDNVIKYPLLNTLFKTYLSLLMSIYLKEICKNAPLSQKTITLLKDQSNNKYINYFSNIMIKELENAINIIDIIKNMKYFNDDFKHTIYISCNSDDMALLLDNYFQMKKNIIKNKIKLSLAMFIPIIISFVGIILILMYLLIMMPILDMGSSM